MVNTFSDSSGTFSANKILATNIDAAIEKAIFEKRIVGTVVIVAQDGEVVYRKAHGFADREALKPMSELSIFRLASLTKPIVSMAALRLIEQGSIQFEDLVTKWLPDFKPRTRNGETPNITIQNLLTHTAGLSYSFLQGKNGPYQRLGISDGLSDNGLSLDENLSRIAQAPLSFSPGKAWQYSVAIDVLGRIVEKVTGEDLEMAVSKLVSQSLGLKCTRFVAPRDWDLVVPYANGTPEPVRMQGDFFSNPVGDSEVLFSPDRAFNPQAFFSGGSGMVGNGDDYILFLEAVRKGLLLSAQNTKKVFENFTGDFSIMLAGPGWGWGLISALLVDPVAAKMPMAPQSLGWSGAYGHTWWIDPVNKLSAVLLTNCSFEGMSGKFPEEIRAAVYQSLK